MSTVNIRRYSDPDTLKEIAPANLIALLKDEAAFLEARGITLPASANDSAIDYEALARLFLSPDDIPEQLVERFYLVNQMSNTDAMDQILDKVHSLKLKLNFAADSSPADVAAQLLLKDKGLFQELHAAKASVSDLNIKHSFYRGATGSERH